MIFYSDHSRTENIFSLLFQQEAAAPVVAATLPVETGEGGGGSGQQSQQSPSLQRREEKKERRAAKAEQGRDEQVGATLKRKLLRHGGIPSDNVKYDTTT